MATTHRVAPGLLSLEAWEAVRGARVLTAEAGHPQRAAVEAAGARVEVVAESGSPLARTLLAAARESGTVVWLAGSDGDPGLTAALAALVGSGAERDVPTIEVVHGSYDLPGARLLDLVAVMDRLRSPGGCPWDREQTHLSLLRHLLEEAYEVVEAAESGDRDHLREELGDLLLQVVFHARIAEEHPDDPWTIDDVAGDLVDKLVRRHPHVFADTEVADAEEVKANWEVLKAAEKQRESAVEGVPLAQPALALAAALVGRADKAGIEVPVPAPPVEYHDEQALGDLLLSVAAQAQRARLDPEAALRAAARRYRERVQTAERRTGSDA